MLNILLIDDDKVEFRLIQRMLEDCFDGPFLLRYAATVKEGITILQSQAVDMILLDDKLNDGRTAEQSVPELRAVTNDIPFILISSAIDAAYLKDKAILDVYDIVDKYKLRQRIREGLLHSI